MLSAEVDVPRAGALDPVPPSAPLSSADARAIDRMIGRPPVARGDGAHRLHRPRVDRRRVLHEREPPRAVRLPRCARRPRARSPAREIKREDPRRSSRPTVKEPARVPARALGPADPVVAGHRSDRVVEGGRIGERIDPALVPREPGQRLRDRLASSLAPSELRLVLPLDTSAGDEESEGEEGGASGHGPRATVRRRREPAAPAVLARTRPPTPGPESRSELREAAASIQTADRGATDARRARAESRRGRSP